ncbi:hypothetical protein RRG08_058789 [Elysia crispata]|uniref:Uncharacterized protein n=1 Tax=Elysia crispata TaxID=231223 RepID=A0AAE1D5V8_9GAST|nr:hypothetical protein RRG08_058789 [Elysia crispata]
MSRRSTSFKSGRIDILHDSRTNAAPEWPTSQLKDSRDCVRYLTSSYKVCLSCAIGVIQPDGLESSGVSSDALPVSHFVLRHFCSSRGEARERAYMWAWGGWMYFTPVLDTRLYSHENKFI